MACLIVGVALLGGCTSAGGTPDATGPAASSVDPKPVEPLTFERYVALGDSYTAAPLVPNLAAARGCFRSTNNYPAVLGRTITVARVVDRSCIAARTTDLTGAQLTETARVRSQFASLTAATDLVTLGIGGNDFDVFTTLITECVRLRQEDPTGSPCRGAMQTDGRDRLLTSLDRTEQRVTAALREIQRRSPRATILVVGYPQLVPATGTCPPLLPLAVGDYAYARDVSRRLSEALEEAAAATGTTYVDVWEASEGHDICSDEPWVNGRFTDFSTAAAYHPFAVEQAAVADLVASSLGY